MHVVVVPIWTLSVMSRLRDTLNDRAFASGMNGSSALFRPIVCNSQR